MKFMNKMFEKIRQSNILFADSGQTRPSKRNILVAESLSAPSASARAESNIALLLMSAMPQQVVVWGVTLAVPSSTELISMARIRRRRLIFCIVVADLGLWSLSTCLCIVKVLRNFREIDYLKS